MGDGHKKTVERLLSTPRAKIPQESRSLSSESCEQSDRKGHDYNAKTELNRVYQQAKSELDIARI